MHVCHHPRCSAAYGLWGASQVSKLRFHGGTFKPATGKICVCVLQVRVRPDTFTVNPQTYVHTMCVCAVRGRIVWMLFSLRGPHHPSCMLRVPYAHCTVHATVYPCVRSAVRALNTWRSYSMGLEQQLDDHYANKVLEWRVQVPGA